MTKEDKNLLLKDLCARLPYWVKISVNNKVESLQGINVLDNVVEYGSFLSCDIEDVKPYLFPLSSMTEEQRFEYHNNCDIGLTECGDALYYDCAESIDWLNKNHFDYRSLIPKGLAIDATGLNIYKKE